MVLSYVLFNVFHVICHSPLNNIDVFIDASSRQTGDRLPSFQHSPSGKLSAEFSLSRTSTFDFSTDGAVAVGSSMNVFVMVCFVCSSSDDPNENAPGFFLNTHFF